MRIVFVVGNYVPRASAVGNCVKNLADCLSEDHEVTVICMWQGVEQPASERIDGHFVVRVGSTMHKIRVKADLGIKSNRIARRLGGRIVRSVSQLQRQARLLISKNACDKALTNAYRKGLEGLNAVPDLIVPTCMPFEAVQAAVEYVDSHEGALLVPFLFDQFADSSTLYKKKAISNAKRKGNLALEEKMLDRCVGTLHITWKEHVDECFPQYRHKLEQVEHPLLVPPEHELSREEYDGRIVYAGAFGAGIREPNYSLGLLRDVITRMDIVREAAFYVPNRASSDSWFKAYAGSSKIQLYDPVPSREIARILAASSWLLSIGNATLDQKISKVYQYMATGKPIIHISSRPDDPTAQELLHYPLALCLYEGSSYERNVELLSDFLTNTVEKQIGFEEVACIFSDELPSSVAERIVEKRRVEY